MHIETLQIRKMHFPGSETEDDFAAIKINEDVFRTDDIDLVKKACERFLNEFYRVGDHLKTHVKPKAMIDTRYMTPCEAGQEAYHSGEIMQTVPYDEHDARYDEWLGGYLFAAILETSQRKDSTT